MNNENQHIIIFKTEDENVSVDVRFGEDTVWLTQEQMGLLFEKSRNTITEHIRNIFAEGELKEEVVCRKFRHTTQHGAIAGKMQEVTIKIYNLDVIISVGYRVKSLRGTQFRQWATKRLNEYIRKGFTMDDERLNVVIAKNYLDEKELRSLGQIVSGYLDFAERQAEREQTMTMQDWAEHLDRILIMSGEKLLTNAGDISHEQAIDKATTEYKKYQQKTLSEVEKSYLETLKQLENNLEP